MQHLHPFCCKVDFWCLFRLNKDWNKIRPLETPYGTGLLVPIPTKQGLKQKAKWGIDCLDKLLVPIPTKQGLKQHYFTQAYAAPGYFWCLFRLNKDWNGKVFLDAERTTDLLVPIPTKQGLKLLSAAAANPSRSFFWCLFRLNKDWNYPRSRATLVLTGLLVPIPTKQGLKLGDRWCYSELIFSF